MNETSRVYAQLIFVGDIMNVCGNYYTVTSITHLPNTVEVENVELEFHYSDRPDRMITVVVPATEILQIKRR